MTIEKDATSGDRWVVCICNDGYTVSLELHRRYRALPDEAEERYQMIRVVDESGEDYLYPKTFFVEASEWDEAVREPLQSE